MTLNRPQQSFPATLEALPDVLACIDECLERVDYDTLTRARIVVEELFINVVRHGRGPDESLQVSLGLECDCGHIKVSFEDSAAPFDPFSGLELMHARLDGPLEARVEGGVGRLLIRQLADSAHYSRCSGHNRVELLFLPRSR